MASEKIRTEMAGNEQSRYLEAEKARLKAEQRLPKPRSGELVYFILVDGEPYPVYTRDE